ncbi:MAG TPA: hypothetical protein VMS32_05205 [Verrucomicrobiae bacterium]|jgi:hypothetical protein|nr:hypothetical protein [Verrucomicrobiae bacterium]
MIKRETLVHFLLAALVAASFGASLPDLSWGGSSGDVSLPGLPALILSVPALIISVIYYGVAGVLTVGWLIIPAIMLAFANIEVLAKVLRGKHALLWAIPLHCLLGVLIAILCAALGFRLPAI